MIKKLKDIIPLSILASGIMITTSIADTFTLRVGSGHPSKPTAYVTNMEKVLVPNIKRRVAAETEHKVRIIEAYAGKIAKVHETLEAVEKGLHMQEHEFHQMASLSCDALLMNQI